MCFVCRRREGFPATRATCLECSSASNGIDGDTLDFCAEHVACDGAYGDDEDAHKSSHRIVQVRKSVPQRLIHEVVSKAQDQVRLMDSFPTHTGENGACARDTRQLIYPDMSCADNCVTHPRCIRCNKIPEQPYWYCLECNGTSRSLHLCDWQ